MYIFCFLLCPLLLFKLLRNLRVESWLAITCVGVYLAAPGFLGPLVMYFRSAKAMTNFSFLLCLYVASELWIRRKERSSIFKSVQFYTFLSILFCSFFWDETALLIYPTVWILFPELLRERKRLMAYLMLPLLVVASYLLVIPTMISNMGITRPNLMDYEVISDSGFLGLAPFIVNTLYNTKMLFADSTGLANPSQIPTLPGRLFFWMNLFGISLLAVRILADRFQKGKLYFGSKLEKTMIIRICLLLLLFAVSHSFLLSLPSHHIYGVYWYGAFWSIGFVLALGLVLRAVQPKAFVFVWLMVMTLSTSYSFLYTNLAFRKCMYMEDCWAGNFWLRGDRFRLGERSIDFRESVTTYLWQRSHLPIPMPALTLPQQVKDLKYLSQELGIRMVWK